MALEIIPYDAGSGMFIPVDEPVAAIASSASAVYPTEIIKASLVPIPPPFIIAIIIFGTAAYLAYKYLRKDHSQVNKSLNTPKR